MPDAALLLSGCIGKACSLPLASRPHSLARLSTSLVKYALPNSGENAKSNCNRVSECNQRGEVVWALALINGAVAFWLESWPLGKGRLLVSLLQST